MNYVNELIRLEREREIIVSALDERIARLRNVVASMHSGDASPLMRAVCDAYELTTQELISGGRIRARAEARHVAMWILRKSGASYPVIGDAMGGMHHTSAIHAIRRVESTPRLLDKAKAILAMIEHGGDLARRVA